MIPAPERPVWPALPAPQRSWVDTGETLLDPPPDGCCRDCRDPLEIHHADLTEDSTVWWCSQCGGACRPPKDAGTGVHTHTKHHVGCPVCKARQTPMHTEGAA